MPELSEITRLTALDTPAGDDVFPIVDVSAAPDAGYGPAIRNLRLNQISGLSPGEVTAVAAGTITATRYNLIISGTTSTVNIPAPTGAVREIIVANGGSGNATVTAPSAVIRTAAAPTAATTSVVATGVTTRFLSNGTNWYRA
jgi:hypothetical protein